MPGIAQPPASDPCATGQGPARREPSTRGIRGAGGEDAMDRRRFLLTSLAGALAAPRAAAAQPSRVPRLCFLALYPDSERPALYRGFIEGLHELGYDPGRNVAIEYLSAD